MAIDPQVEAVLARMAKAGMPPFHTLTSESARKLYNNEKLAGPKESVFRVEDLAVPGPEGKIPIRIYTPEEKGPFGAFVYFHGGGWVIGSLDSYDSLCRTFANRIGCVVVSVDYRLAPEHKFPAAIEDAYYAVKWISENSQFINVDPRRIAIGGDSAGGNIAAAVSLMANDRGNPSLIYQVLIYPVTLYSADTASYKLYEEGYFLTRKCMNWFWEHYLQNKEDGFHPYASPLLAEDLQDLPPTLIITAEYDPLRDEGEAYASKLKKFGVPVIFTRYEGMIHGFFTFYGVIKQGDAAVDQVVRELRFRFFCK